MKIHNIPRKGKENRRESGVQGRKKVDGHGAEGKLAQEVP